MEAKQYNWTYSRFNWTYKMELCNIKNMGTTFEAFRYTISFLNVLGLALTDRGKTYLFFFKIYDKVSCYFLRQFIIFFALQFAFNHSLSIWACTQCNICCKKLYHYVTLSPTFSNLTSRLLMLGNYFIDSCALGHIRRNIERKFLSVSCVVICVQAMREKKLAK